MWNLQALLDYYEQYNMDPWEGCTVPEPIDGDLLKSYIIRRCGLLQPIYGEPNLFKMQIKMWYQSNQWKMAHLVKMLLADYSPAENIYEHDEWSETHSGTDINGGQDTFEHGEKHTLSGQDTFEHGEKHTLSGQDTFEHGEKHTLSGQDTFEHGEKHTLSGQDTFEHGEKHTLGGKDSEADSTNNEHTVSAYNANTYQPDSKDQKGGSIDTTYGKTDTASGTDTTGYGKTDTASGTDTTGYGKTDTASGTDTTGYGKTDTASGTDTTGYGKTDTASGTDTTGYGKTFTHGEKIEYERDRHGNVGVKSSSDLMQEELNLLERFNVYDILASWFEADNMIQLY